MVSLTGENKVHIIIDEHKHSQYFKFMDVWLKYNLNDHEIYQEVRNP